MMPRGEPQSPLERLTLALATGLGVGYSPIGPGTIGSLWGLAIAGGLSAAGLSGVTLGLVCLPLVLVGVPICGRAARLLGRKDPRAVVFDELAALPLAFLGVDFTLHSAVVAFFTFRLFDITKPWPVSRMERWPGGWGVMADDVAAALLAAPLVWALVEVSVLP